MRENLFIQWLDTIAADAEELYLLGDIFDFWFEYGTVVPKGYTRLLGKLAELRDKGMKIFFFTGNHDMWMFDYFPRELGIPVLREPVRIQLGSQHFLIGHGDGLGPGDHGYKRLKKIFANPTCQWLFARLHPNLGIRLAWYWSGKSRAAQPGTETWLGAEREWLVQYCERKIQVLDTDFFVFGHRHLPVDYLLSNGHSRYLNLGEWMNFNTYAVYDGEQLELKAFEKELTVFGREKA
jgi:UDP-2,3-diacylglucosamine hydrolase